MRHKKRFCYVYLCVSRKILIKIVRVNISFQIFKTKKAMIQVSL